MTRGKDHCFVCDSQNKKKHFFISSFLNFCFFLSVMEAEMENMYCHLTQHLKDLYLALCEHCQLKDTETGISLTSNPFTLHEFSVPGRREIYAV